MKNLKVKSILFSLLAMMAVAVFLTSCEQPEAIIGDDSTGFLVEEDFTTYDVTDLPDNLPSPKEVLEWSLNESTHSEEDITLRSGICGCSRVTDYNTNGYHNHKMAWKSENNLALFIYHYRISGNKYLGYTRLNPDTSGCHSQSKNLNINLIGVNGPMRSVAFLGSGYTTCSLKTGYWNDNIY